jgi:hypothetical protein
VISGQSYPLSVDSENSDNVIIVKGDIEVLDHKLTGAVLNFDPSDDIHRSNNDSSNHNNSTSSNNSNHSNDGNNDNSTVTYKMKKEFQVQQSAVLGTNFPVSSTDYTMLTNVTLNKTEVCMEEELRIDTSFVYPNGIPGGVSVNVGGSSGGDSVIVVFYETGLKLIPVTVSDYNHNTESINIPVMVNDCTKPGIVRIQEVPNAEDAGHTFFAQTPDMAAPITYSWDFGDTQTTTTQSSMVTHSFTNRIQSSMTDSFLITVTATNTAETRTAQTSISMVNLHMVAALFKGQYTLGGKFRFIFKKKRFFL